jgi:hypothetical protein
MRWLARRPRTGLAAGASVLASPAVGDVVAALADLLNVAVAGLLFYEMALADGLLGLRLSWLVVAYLVYEYAPEMYLGFFGDLAGARGFRVLTAVGATLFGLLFSVFGGLVPPAVALGLVPAGGEGATAALFAGGAATVVAFAGYVRLGRGQHLATDDSDVFGAFEGFTVDAQGRMFERSTALSWPTRRLLHLVTAVAVAALLALPCVFAGLTLGVVNAFYPVPELLVVAGVAGGAVVDRTGVGARLEAAGGVDVQRFAAGRATDAVRNFKGMVLGLYCGCGLFVAGIAFLLGVTLLGPAVEGLAAAVTGLPALADADPSTAAAVAGRLWLVVGVVALPVAYGTYGLLYWLTQLARVPGYARHWERRRRGLVGGPPAASVARPPGLFVPGDLLLVALAALLALAGGGESLSPLALAAFGVAWPVALAVVVRSAWLSVRSTPQSLAGEDRAVVVALALQVGTVATLGLAGGGSGAASTATVVPVVVALVVAFAYFPDVSVYADRQVGAAAYLDVAYVCGLFALALPALAALGLASPWLYGLVAVLLALLVLFSYLDERVEG